LRFGPEQESVLPPLNGKWTFLNLRANHLVTTSKSDFESRAFHDWQHTNGADMGAAVEEKFPVLLAYGMATAPAIANGPDTYYFRTRDDAWGILQITGFTENPRGVKIRYKLVQNGW
jgi:hypothetical protein